MLSTTMGKVEALGLHLRSDPTTVDLEDQIAEGSVGKIEIPHVLEGTLVDGTTGVGTTDRPTKGITTVGDRRHPLNDVQGVLQQDLLNLVLSHGGLDLALDGLPDVVEGGLGGC